MKIQVEDTTNGYIITNFVWESTDEHGNKIIDEEREVVETEFDDKKESLSKILYIIAGYLGYINNKYGEDNLNIQFNKKGSKSE
jgi:hypothetical protein